MKLAVKFYPANHEAGPEGWPFKCREVGDDDSLPEGFDEIMTPEELADYQQRNRKLYNDWIAMKEKRRDRFVAFSIGTRGELTRCGNKLGPCHDARK